MKLTAIAAAFAVLMGSASAAVVQFDLNFFRPDGSLFGTGSVSWDPAVKEDIKFDQDNIYNPAFCAIFPDDCRTVATWTPLTASFDLPAGFARIPSEPWFAEGSVYVTLGRTRFESELLPGDWLSVGDDLEGEVLEISFNDFVTGFFFFAGFLDDGTFVESLFGRVEFQRVEEIPLPAAAWFFVAGLGALAFRSRAPIKPKSLQAVARW